MATQISNPPDNYPKAVYNVGVNATPNSSAEHQLLMNAISTCAYQLIQQLLDKDASILHEPGWHGQTALHKACLIGDFDTVSMLLRYGADPNAKNEYDETPLHYACKRGVPVIINLLIKNGGNLDAVDKNGNSMCHHAAQTGSVYSLAFLFTQQSNYQTINKNLQLPLHITCQFGHVDAFKYLLKKEKHDIQQTDIDGNNVLHIAAKEGHQMLVWDILKIGGCELLHVENKNGSTPDDLASRHDKFGHKVIAPLLTSLRKHKPRNYMVTDPMGLWYWILVKPFLMYTFLLFVIAMVTKYVDKGYQGYIMVVGIALILWTIIYRVHRIDHISRMQNPIFAGTFAAGLIHTTIHYVIVVLPYSMESMLLTGVSLVMACVTYTVYYVLLTRDPGRATQSEFNPVTKLPMTIIDICQNNEKLAEFCTVCEIVKPTRTKHCRLCETCFSEMDHHCLFLVKCIALRNHVLFVWFLIVVVISMVIYEMNLIYYLIVVAENQTWREVLSNLFHNDAWTLSLGVANLFSILWGVNLVKFQLNMVSMGQLTAIVQYTKKKSGLTSEEKFWNVIYFLRAKPAYIKDPYLAAQNL